MEDPARDVEGFLHTLLDNPTLRQQEETLRRYFTEDVEFYHFYVNSRGLSTLIALYHIGKLLGNYSGVVIHALAYDEVKNTIAIRITVFLRPMFTFFQRTPLQMSVWLELEDVVEVIKAHLPPLTVFFHKETNDMYSFIVRKCPRPLGPETVRISKIIESLQDPKQREGRLSEVYVVEPSSSSYPNSQLTKLPFFIDGRSLFYGFFCG